MTNIMYARTKRQIRWNWTSLSRFLPRGPAVSTQLACALDDEGWLLWNFQLYQVWSTLVDAQTFHLKPWKHISQTWCKYPTTLRKNHDILHRSPWIVSWYWTSCWRRGSLRECVRSESFRHVASNSLSSLCFQPTQFQCVSHFWCNMFASSNFDTIWYLVSLCMWWWWWEGVVTSFLLIRSPSRSPMTQSQPKWDRFQDPEWRHYLEL